MTIKHDAPNTIYANDKVDDFQVDSSYDERDGKLIPEQDEHGYRIIEEPYGTKRPVHIIVMGAGASTAHFLAEAERRLTNVKISVFEKNKDVGGTWFENRYPGCACDIPSVTYQYSWKPKLWNHFYAFAQEIHGYIRSVYDEIDAFNKYVKLEHKVVGANWDENKSLWVVKVENCQTGEVFTVEGNYFINCGGVLNDWKYPDIPGIKDFKGKLMHTASWDKSVDLKDKKVAVIGAGSSGIQLVASIQPSVKHFYHWVRTPVWITSAFHQTWAGEDGNNFKYTKEQQQWLAENPEKYLAYRKQIEDELNMRFHANIKGSEGADAARKFSENLMARRLKHDKRLVDKIIPKTFNPGCRRPTPAPGYLEALVAPNATIFTEAINQITEKGFKDQAGNEYEVDIIVCATGFNNTWLPNYPFTGKGGIDIKETWNEKEGVTPYLSVGVPGFPNYYVFCGAYGPLAHGSFMPLIETWTKYIFDMVEKGQVEHIRSYTPKWEPCRQFRQHADLYLQRTVFTSNCRSWFKGGKADGQPTLWPGSRLHYMHILETPRYEDYEIEYEDSNIFAFLGNGFDTREQDGRDITHYMGSLNGKDEEPVYGSEVMEHMCGKAAGNIVLFGRTDIEGVSTLKPDA